MDTGFAGAALRKSHPRTALSRSIRLTKGARWRIAAMVLPVAAAVALLPFLLALGFDGLAGLLFRVTPERLGLLSLTMGMLLAA